MLQRLSQQEVINYEAGTIAIRYSQGAVTITAMYGHGAGTITIRYSHGAKTIATRGNYLWRRDYHNAI